MQSRVLSHCPKLERGTIEYGRGAVGFFAAPFSFYNVSNTVTVLTCQPNKNIENLHNAMSYIRTPAGTAAALNPKIVMSRQAKALLIAMNGQFDPHSYASRVPGAQTVPAMLEMLVQDGYVRVAPYADVQTVGFVATKPAALTAVSQPDDHRAVQDAVAAMTDFVMQHLPNDALEISFELESLTSIAQLEASLGLYEAKIQHLGPSAVEHLAKLKRMMRAD